MGFPVQAMRSWFFAVNENGRASLLLAGLAAIGIVVYIVSTFAAINTGLAMQSRVTVEDTARRAVAERALVLEERVSRLAEEHKTILESMEKASSLIYVTAGAAPSYSLLRQ